MSPDELFLCSHFGRPLAVKHCLRRQKERRQRVIVVRPAEENAHGTHPRITKTMDAGPVYVFCATSCSKGREISAAAGPLPPAAEEAEPQEEPSARIWSGGVPDVPIAPPHRVVVGLDATAAAEVAGRVREALQHPTRVATPPRKGKAPPVSGAPAEPAVDPLPSASSEGTTEGGHVNPPRTCACGCGRPLRPCNRSGYSKHCDAQRYALERAHNSAATAAMNRPAPPAPAKEEAMPCPECKSPTCHKVTCSRRPGGAPPKVAPPPKPKNAKTRRVRVVEKHAARKQHQADLDALEVPELLDLRRAVDEELRGRLAVIEVERTALREALDADAKVLRGEAA